jgi:hypothetical protein
VNLVRREQYELPRVQPDRTRCERDVERALDALDGHLARHLVGRKRLARHQDHAHDLEVLRLEHRRGLLGSQPVSEWADVDDLAVDSVRKCHAASFAPARSPRKGKAG